MIATFGEAASRLAGAAGRLLGWRPDEFWTATPAELANILTTHGDEAPPDGDTMTALIAQFPD